MSKGNKLSEFVKAKITALKRVGESQRKISEALGLIKTVIYNYLKSPNKYGTRKSTGRPKKLSPQFKRRTLNEVKKKTLSTLKILKSLLSSLCNTRSIKRHLNLGIIKHKKRIHRPMLSMKHKKKRLEYVRQYMEP